MRPVIPPKASARKAAVIVMLFYVAVVMPGCININVGTREGHVEVPQERIRDNQEETEGTKGEMKDNQEGTEGTKGEMKDNQEGTEGTKGEMKDNQEGTEGTKGEMKDNQEGTEGTKGEMKDNQEGTEGTKGEMKDNQEGTEGTKGEMKDNQEGMEGTKGEMKDNQEGMEGTKGEMKDNQEKTDTGWSGLSFGEKVQIALAVIGLLFSGGAGFHFRKNMLNGVEILLNLLKGGKEEKENIYIYFLKSSNDKTMQAQRGRLKNLGFNCVDDIKDISNNKLDVLQNLHDNAVYIVGYSDDYDYKKLLDMAKHKKSRTIFFANLGEIKSVENLELINDGINNCDVAYTMNGLAISLSNLLKIS